MENSSILQFSQDGGENGRKVADKSKVPLRKSGLKAWRERVQKSTESFRGASGNGHEYMIRLQVAGSRRYADLGTADLDEAAKRARSFYFDVQSIGWVAALQKLHPARPAPSGSIDSLTVGEYLAAVKEIWTVRELTYWEACGKFRRLVSLILGLEAKAEEKWCGPKRVETPWQKRINAVRISALTPDAVIATMEKYLKARGGDADNQLAAKHTINSLVRNSRSLFSRKHIVPRLKIAVPAVLPFDGVKLFNEKLGEFRFRRSVDVNALISSAHEELAQTNPRLFIIFLLALGAGLRRGEIDKLRWRELVQISQQVEVIKSEVFDAKSYTSLRKVKLPPQFYEIVLRFRGDASLDAFVIPSPRAVMPNIRSRKYRCDREMKALNVWLESKGVRPRDRKKIQTLRKMFGDAICSHFGIYKAAAALGHQKVSTTERYYAAPPEVEAAPFSLSS